MNLIADIKINEYSNDIQANQLKYVFLYLKYVMGLPNFDHLLSLFQRDIRKTKPSQLHLDCSKQLESLGIEFDIESNINGLFVDIYIESLKTIIQIQGPTHYGYKVIKD